jgi:hypothetical protein
MGIEKPFMIFTAKTKKAKNLSLSCKKPSKIFLKKELFFILLFQEGNKLIRVKGTTTSMQCIVLAFWISLLMIMKTMY